jgi:hypothetical protein
LFLKTKNKPKNQKANFEIDKDGEYFFLDGENALTAIEDIKKYSDNFELETPVRVPSKPGASKYDTKRENKIFRPGENYADDVVMENDSLSYVPSYGPLEYVDEFTEDIINTILPKRTKKASGGRMDYGIKTLRPNFATGGRIRYSEGSPDIEELRKRVEELMDDGETFGDAVKIAVKELENG